MPTPPDHPPPPPGDDEVTIERGHPSAAALTTMRFEAAPESAGPRRPWLLVMAGPRLGEMVPIEGQIVIGRDPAAGLPILDEGVSRRHARVTVEDGEVRLTDLDSTNGTWVEGHRVTSRRLADGDRFRVGQTTVIKFAWQDEIEEQYQRQLLDTALRDVLTPAFNARYFDERLEAEVASAERHKLPLAVLAVGVDRLGLVNRMVTRAVGDGLLRRLAEVIHGAVRADDVLARLDGDTFGLLARDTNREGAQRLADRLRGVVADALFDVQGRPVELRISVGVAALAPGAPRSAPALLEAARAALAEAKSCGRNRVAVEEHVPRNEP